MFGRSKYWTQKQVRDWANEQVRKGIPRQQICAELSAKILNAPRPRLPDLEKATQHNEACRAMYNSLMESMISRNEQAHQMEKSGNTDRAIELYEQSVQDQFNGTIPYERLRIIYTKLKRYNDAIRVCNEFVSNQYLLGGTNGAKDAFKKHIENLKNRLDKP